MTAQEMFETLGYKQQKTTHLIIYSTKKKEFVFIPMEKEVMCLQNRETLIENCSYQIITLKELEAINKQLEELEL